MSLLWDDAWRYYDPCQPLGETIGGRDNHAAINAAISRATIGIGGYIGRQTIARRETPDMTGATPFRVDLPEARIEAIRHQVRVFPWDAMPTLIEHGDPWSAGADPGFLRSLCDYWVDGFDWRAQETAINRFPQLMAEIDGHTIHVLHERGSGPRDTALVLTHGWPGSIVEFLAVIDRLAHPERSGGAAAEGIDVVVPALPGFGCSGRPAAPIGPRRIAGLWDKLLREVLGYRSYIAQGGDWGSMVSAMAGLDHSVAKGGGCTAIHINMLGARVEGASETEAERAYEARCDPFLRDGRAYADTHRTRPQTLAYAMQDNPVGAAAWIIDKFHAWSDRRGPTGEQPLTEVFSRDTLLTNLMFYVATGSFATATWIYRAVQDEVVRVLPAGTRIDVPTGYLSLPREIRPLPPRGLLEKTYRVVRFSELDRGGHFAALEQPDLFVADVAAFVRQVREMPGAA
jgi:microsomal epoxide hydrolase